MTTPDPIATVIQTRLAALQADGRLSVWSLIITFMGDAISPRGGLVSAGAVQALMARFGIGHGAVRTAVSRLSADGWIERQREGRNSFYRLSPEVTETVHAAEQRIYAASSLLGKDVPRTLVIEAVAFSTEALAQLEANSALMLAPQLALCFAPAKTLPRALRPPAVTLAMSPTIATGAAMRDRFAEARQWSDIVAFSAAYAPVADALDNGASPAPQDAMALRCLLIHEWRRIALKILPIPADLLMPDDPEPDARARAAEIYAHLIARSEAWLDAHAGTMAGPLPPPDTRLAGRFQPL